MSVVVVEITEREYRWAAYAGILRRQESLFAGLKRPDKTEPSYDDDVNGAVGEFIVSIATGIPWRGPGPYRGDDLIGGLQVRTTPRSNGKLIIRPRDNDESRFVLVTGTGNPLRWSIPGWILAKEAKQEIFKDDPTRSGLPSAFFVDQTFLNPIKDLKVR